MASQGRCLLVGLVPPDEGKFPAVRGFLESREEGGALEEKGVGVACVCPPGPSPVQSSDALTGQPHLWLPKSLSAFLPTPPLSGAGKKPDPGSPPGPSRPLCTRGSRPGCSQGDPDRDRAGGTLRPPPPGRHPSCLRGETGLSLSALVSRKLLTRTS